MYNSYAPPCVRVRQGPAAPIALSLLCPGGTFLCKVYDCFTPFTAGLLYFMFRHCDRMAIVKPLTSRPSNAERYVLFPPPRGLPADPWVWNDCGMPNKVCLINKNI